MGILIFWKIVSAQNDAEMTLKHPRTKEPYMDETRITQAQFPTLHKKLCWKRIITRQNKVLLINFIQKIVSAFNDPKILLKLSRQKVPHMDKTHACPSESISISVRLKKVLSEKIHDVY